ncbi:MAG: DUF1772 domain-containing protein [Armatimonadetes bacterium]|nr:DUF1772 domain-containing protein [Anaerolineae bacterium]
MPFENVILVVAGTLSGLIAGLFYAFNVAIVPALRRLKATQHIAVIQAINVKIKNPVFFLSFFGPTMLLPLAAWLHRGGSQFPLLAAAAALHIIGANGITIIGNIPLNERLDAVDPDQLADAEAERIRHAFQGADSPWMRWHTLRTLASIVATVLVFMACLSKNVPE